MKTAKRIDPIIIANIRKLKIIPIGLMYLIFSFLPKLDILQITLSIQKVLTKKIIHGEIDIEKERLVLIVVGI